MLQLYGSTGPASSLLYHGLPAGSQPPLGIHLHLVTPPYVLFCFLLFSQKKSRVFCQRSVQHKVSLNVIQLQIQTPKFRGIIM